MTTPTLREAADNLIVLDQCRMTPPDDVFRTSLKLAANTLRAIADAQSDAGKGYKSWFFENIRAVEGVHVNSDGSTMMRSELIDQGYLAGHAQGYAAALAAQEAKVKELEEKVVTFDYRQGIAQDMIEANGRGLVEMEAALATAKADALELANEVRRLRPYRDKYIEQCHNMRPGELDEDFEKRRNDAVLNDRPAAVTAAMERYK